MRCQTFLQTPSGALKELANRVMETAKLLPHQDEFREVRIACNRFAYECLSKKQVIEQMSRPNVRAVGGR
jgi:hypothetical protein